MRKRPVYCLLVLMSVILASNSIFAQDTRRRVIVYRFYNSDSVSHLQYLSGVIADQVPLKILEDRNFVVTVKQTDDSIRSILNAADDETRNLLLETLDTGSDFIIFGSFSLDKNIGKVVIKTYAYNMERKTLFRYDDIISEQGAVLVENLKPLSEKCYSYLLDESFSDRRKMYNRGLYRFLKGSYFEFSYGVINFTGSQGKYLKDDFISSVSYIFSFYDADLFPEIPLVNVSGFGIKHSYFDARNTDAVLEPSFGYARSFSFNYYFFFRPADFVNIDFYAGSGIGIMRNYKDPITNGSSSVEKDINPMINAGTDLRFIINHLSISTGLGFTDTFMDDSQLTGFYMTAGIGIRF